MTSGLYTGNGDNGTTKFFHCNQKRISKSSSVAEALGSLDELNSFLGMVKVEADKTDFALKDVPFTKVIEDIQQDIFIICAKVAGADKEFNETKVGALEEIISECEQELPPIKTFTLSGGSELSARFDFARTLARLAERRVVLVNDELVNISGEILKYLNRLSSTLFALARLSNLRAGAGEIAPDYK